MPIISLKNIGMFKKVFKTIMCKEVRECMHSITILACSSEFHVLPL
jgi:hypothetical protein